VADVPSGPNWTPPPTIPIIKILSEDVGLGVFKNKVLRRICTSKREKQVRGRELHNEEFPEGKTEF
jgi:hypothetical protein